ncbi:hypothetical protein DERP_003918 [Dermatophagoides pteronyssinus]|uniref:Uncharacterized protein n=1 Tax=Dermatophagoides pteronyssinus TaxID=6956 RepID=A0ABQ8J7R8_DERPT|nr:hypothetical protein DERP_003918 [Dermatophagoides pteronyssinus]
MIASTKEYSLKVDCSLGFQQFPDLPQRDSQILHEASAILPNINGYAINADAAPIVNPLSIGSTDLNDINALAVRAVADTIEPPSTTIKYGTKFVHLSISR